MVIIYFQINFYKRFDVQIFLHLNKIADVFGKQLLITNNDTGSTYWARHAKLRANHTYRPDL